MPETRKWIGPFIRLKLLLDKSTGGEPGEIFYIRPECVEAVYQRGDHTAIVHKSGETTKVFESFDFVMALINEFGSK